MSKLVKECYHLINSLLFSNGQDKIALSFIHFISSQFFLIWLAISLDFAFSFADEILYLRTDLASRIGSSVHLLAH